MINKIAIKEEVVEKKDHNESIHNVVVVTYINNSR
jgi:hypothetical protein